MKWMIDLNDWFNSIMIDLMESQPTLRHRSTTHVQALEFSCGENVRRDRVCNTPKSEYPHHLSISSHFQVCAATKIQVGAREPSYRPAWSSYAGAGRRVVTVRAPSSRSASLARNG